ncbi:Secretory immunoglobulin A-binding protein EsiB [Saezia sanguinis]|uniref:Secretory immunoglobulin A-binding protein EsiB n=1 Tax=Saezia sanguinis TaxID=1965230 RepID=A0A433SAB7_9BURK|nr:Secretory immunoglobulin A-binding protein EsiB [Saezia sanguinis]
MVTHTDTHNEGAKGQAHQAFEQGAVFYQQGLSTDDKKELNQKFNEAATLFTVAAEHGHADAQYTLAQIYASDFISGLDEDAHDQIDHEKAVYWLKRLIRQCELPTDESERFKYAQEALELLGRMTWWGIGCVPDKAQAVAYFQAAAAQGDEEAKLALFIIYFTSDYGTQDERLQSLQWLTEELGDEDDGPDGHKVVLACYYLGDGEKRPADYAQAARWFSGAVQEYVSCFFEFERDKPLPVYTQPLHKDSAMPDIERLANAGDVDAMYLAGWRCMKGMGVSKDVRQALLWWEKAAACGYLPALFQIGRHYAQGLVGVTQDEKKAAEAYFEACKSFSVQNGFDAEKVEENEPPLAQCLRMLGYL